MTVLKSVEKRKFRFLMNFDYNNVLGRLKYILGKEAYFFADIRIRQNDITWSTKDNIEYKSFCEASEAERQDIKKYVDRQIVKFTDIISEDSLIGNYVQLITAYPSDQFIYYTQINGEYKIVLTGWGCETITEHHSEQKDSQGLQKNSHNIISEDQQHTPTFSRTLLDGTAQEKVHSSKHEKKEKTDGSFAINPKKNCRNKKDQKHSKINIKSIILILLAAIVVLIIPVFLTGVVNRLVADLTYQWYLNNLSRVLITIFVAITTYSVAYFIIRLTTLKKSITFNVVCFILTFLWSVFMGIAWIPD